MYFSYYSMVIQSGISELVSRAGTLHHTTHMLQRRLRAVFHGEPPFAREAGVSEELLCFRLLHLLHTSLGRFAHVGTMVF